MADTYIIMCTVRNYNILNDYFKNAIDHHFNLKRLHVVLVTEDFCDKGAMRKFLTDLGVSGDVYNERDRADWFSSHGIAAYTDLIPRSSHAQTSFGLLCMFADMSCRQGIFIDDDTAPEPDFDFFGHHLANLDVHGPTPTASSDDRVR